VPVGHEQREPEPAQHALGGAFPVGVLGPDPDQLAGEGQVRLGEPGRRQEPGAQLQAGGGDVDPAPAQLEQLGVQLGFLVPEPGRVDGEPVGLLPLPGAAALVLGVQPVDLRPARGEHVRGPDRRQPEHREVRGVGGGPAASLVHLGRQQRHR
jgi:hypothetical protein